MSCPQCHRRGFHPLSCPELETQGLGRLHRADDRARRLPHRMGGGWRPPPADHPRPPPLGGLRRISVALATGATLTFPRFSRRLVWEACGLSGRSSDACCAPAEFRQRAAELARPHEKPSEIARDLGISEPGLPARVHLRTGRALGVPRARSRRKRWNADEIEPVAATLNGRPRKALGWKTPAEALDEHLATSRQLVLLRSIESGQYTSRAFGRRLRAAESRGGRRPRCWVAGALLHLDDGRPCARMRSARCGSRRSWTTWSPRRAGDSNAE
jgi:hypothetical protein